MKKNYIAPSVETYQLETKNTLLNASVQGFHAEEAAGTGDTNNRVSFGRGGIFDDSEE